MSDNLAQRENRRGLQFHIPLITVPQKTQEQIGLSRSVGGDSFETNPGQGRDSSSISTKSNSSMEKKYAEIHSLSQDAAVVVRG